MGEPEIGNIRANLKSLKGDLGFRFKNEATGEWLDADAEDEKKYKAEEIAFLSGIPPYWGGNEIAMAMGIPGDIRMSKAPFSVGDIRTTTWVIKAPNLARLHGSVLRSQHEILQVMSVSTYVRAKKSIMAQISSRRASSTAPQLRAHPALQGLEPHILIPLLPLAPPLL